MFRVAHVVQPVVALVVALPLWACATTGDAPMEVSDMTMQLASPAFAEGGQIPSRHTCDGEDVSPALEWSGTPDGTAELALVIDDPDARGFVHWVVVGIPVHLEGLEEGRVPEGASEGGNNFGGSGYRGPCPPSGSSHRYVITLYALSQPLEVSAIPTADEVRQAAANVTLAEGRLTANYSRR